MHVLIVTSLSARKIVEKEIEKIKESIGLNTIIDVLALPISVIALAPKEFIKHHLLKHDLKKYDYIILPGTIKYDLKDLSEELGIKIVKSPSRIELLKTMFLIGLEKFSPSISGDKIIEQNIEQIYATANKYFMEKTEWLRINNKNLVPLKPPPIVLGLLYDHVWGEEFLEQYIRVFKPDIIYLTESSTEKTFEKLVKLGYSGRLAVPPNLLDTQLLKHVSIIYGIRIDEISNYLKYNKILHVQAQTINNKLLSQLKNYRDKIIIDPILPTLSSQKILDKLNEYKSIIDYAKAGWITNISYSIDADTHSLYPFLLELLIEAGVSLLIIHEFEEKLVWSLQEIVEARKLLTISRYLGTNPRDIGIDLLYLKSKTYVYPEYEKPDKIVFATRDPAYQIDPMGIFKIRVNHKEHVIEVLYIGRKGKILIKGRSCEEIRDTILRLGLVSLMNHAFYLGGEICRAYEALRISKNYEQEKPLLPQRWNTKNNQGKVYSENLGNP
ncbi:DUF4346 domain-containing protein [Staphylothermus hellenicus]|uniref:Dihydropteroate synthase-related protein n=1 Tax=Staphylothermus hellenicus (strain DSM 12710 / JCM 10830 / BK20S6-10-b1 / P8) TaxID=591019 RepID=D7D837_STAHD|nr:DUF6513 domain-containing protein [Staphylothermus hellenicus]ADI31933.1 hypothetical protein Shell_0820 [Staphylothermus hellenicus DSM 12710]